MKKSNAAKPKQRSARAESLVPAAPPELERTRRHSTVVPKDRDVTPASPAGRPSSRPPITNWPRWDQFDIQLFCPFHSGLNPHVDRVQRESVDWALRMRLIPKEARDRLDGARIAWLSAYVFHDAPAHILQLAADWTTLFCLLDDYVESMNLGPVRISAELSRLVAGFRSGTAQRSVPIAVALLDLRRRVDLVASSRWVERFANALEELFGGYLWEEINRWKKIRPSYLAYRTMREVTIGLRPQFLLGELASGTELPDWVRADAHVQRLEALTSQTVGWANDVFTYTKELESGEIHNLVFVLMEADSLPLARALHRAAALHDEDVRSFLSVQMDLPGFGSDDAQVSNYVAMLSHWMRGHLDWAHKTGRYDGGVRAAQV